MSWSLAPKHGLSLRLSLAILALAGLSWIAPSASSAADDPAARRRVLKALELQQLRDEGRRHLFGEEREERERFRGREVDPEFVERREEERDFRRGPRPEVRRAGTFRAHGAGVTPNVQVSNPTGEEAGSSQNEPSIGAWASYVLAAYNDWPSLDSLGSIQGYSYSVDGGQTFTDAGMVPSPEGFIWASDPVIAVNEKSGDFFYCGLLEDSLDSGNPENGVGIVKGTFSGLSFAWGTPRIVRRVFNAEHFLDKPWMAADSANGNVYITYTDFFPDAGQTSDQVLFERSRDQGVSWEALQALNLPEVNGNVQGSRPAVGPSSEIYVVWKEIGPSDPGSDFMRIRKSFDGGTTFQPELTVAEFFDNYGTGAPGFNREKSVALPSIAVDRSTTARRGRVYVSWNESLNWYDDAPAIGTIVNETEYNDYFLDPDLFTPGQTLVGTFRDDDDFDSWAFDAVQDSSYIFWADSVTGSTYRLRIFCADSLTRLTYTGHPELPLDATGNQGVMVWTAPSTGRYYLDMTNARIEGRDVGTYRIRTGFVHRNGTDRARDHRDPFVTSSANGTVWSAPVLASNDPPHFDGWLPELAVAGDGEAFVTWYDWRDSPAACGGASHVYLARSQNGGASWTSDGAITDQQTNWTQVNSNLIPNEGDYLGLFANQNAVYACWTDGRLGDSDVDGTVISLLPVELRVSGTASVNASAVTLTWQFQLPRVVSAKVYRRDLSGQVLLGTFVSNASGHLVVVDTTGVRGSQYIYNLGVDYLGTERSIGDVVVTLGAPPVLSLTMGPNPMRRFGIVYYSLPNPGGDVRMTVHDVTGRRVRVLVRDARPGGPLQVGWNALDDDRRLVPPGVYLIRLTFGGKTLSHRVVVMP